jgi:transporter family-2 protein
MNAGFLALAVWAGVMLPMQAVVNARLTRAVGGPIWAAAISALVVALVLAGIAAASGKPVPRTVGLSSLPWWAWTGGLCGALVLSATTAVAPRIGAASMIALVMAGQVLGSLAIDSFGLFGLATQPMSPSRILAALLLIAGAGLMTVKA